MVVIRIFWLFSDGTKYCEALPFHAEFYSRIAVYLVQVKMCVSVLPAVLKVAPAPFVGNAIQSRERQNTKKKTHNIFEDL